MEINYLDLITIIFKALKPLWGLFAFVLIFTFVIGIINKKIRQLARKKKLLNLNLGICPQCGGIIVERNGKFGKFLGCSNYPICKYTK